MKHNINKAFTVCFSMLVAGIAHADVILESATLGTTGLTSGAVLGAGGQSLGARFQVMENTTVECIGGHINGSDTNLFGAIVALSSESDLPDDLPDGSVGGPDFIYVNLFDPETPSTDLLVSTSLVLRPGYYGVVFGSDYFGADAVGHMPPNGSDTPAASYFFNSGFGWTNGVLITCGS